MSDMNVPSTSDCELSDIKVPSTKFTVSFTPNKSFGAPDTMTFHGVTNIRILLNGHMCVVKERGGYG